MADNIEPQVDAEAEDWLAQALAEEDENESGVVAEAEREAEEQDEKEAKGHQVAYLTKEEYRAEREIEKLDKTWEANASEVEKNLVAIWRRGDETPAQLKKLMQLARTKAAETAPSAEEVEKKAAEIAQNELGVGPIATSGTPRASWRDVEADIDERIGKGQVVEALTDAMMLSSKRFKNHVRR
jgi:hypothetical protein